MTDNGRHVVRGQQSAIMTYFLQHPGKRITAEMLVEHTGLDRKQVIAALWSIRQTGKLEITQLSAGGPWVYREEGEIKQAPITALKQVAVRDCYEKIGSLDDGRIILSGPSMTTWVAKEI